MPICCMMFVAPCSAMSFYERYFKRSSCYRIGGGWSESVDATPSYTIVALVPYRTESLSKKQQVRVRCQLRNQATRESKDWQHLYLFFHFCIYVMGWIDRTLAMLKPKASIERRALKDKALVADSRPSFSTERGLPDDLNLAVSPFFVTFVLLPPPSAAVGRWLEPKPWTAIMMVRLTFSLCGTVWV